MQLFIMATRLAAGALETPKTLELCEMASVGQIHS
jgi:hypothetical protein